MMQLGFRPRLALLMLAAATFFPALAKSQTPESATLPPGTVLDDTEPPGNNYDKAAFRLWYPQSVPTIDAVVVLMPGSNGDARPMIDDPVWRDFATRHRLALLGCQLTDKPHDQNFIEVYANASQGSGQALLDGLVALAKRSDHAELAAAPLLLWGMSAGGEFNYEFVAWKPERVVAFVVNKGGIYYTALTSRATRSVPGILFTGGKDLDSRRNTIAGLFALNRRAGALWAFGEEPGVAHIVGKSRDVAMIFFEDVLPLRLQQPNAANAGSSISLKPLADKSGFVGDLKLKSYQPAASVQAPGESTVWLPTERAARAWQALVTEKPPDP